MAGEALQFSPRNSGPTGLLENTAKMDRDEGGGTPSQNPRELGRLPRVRGTLHISINVSMPCLKKQSAFGAMVSLFSGPNLLNRFALGWIADS